MSSSFSFASAGADMGGRTRNNSESALQNNDDDMYMEEDERMVEELLLLPSSSSQSPSSMSTTASYSTPSSPSPSQPSSSFFSESPSSPSLFATTDPFYLAQLQLEQQQQAQQQQQQMMLQSQSVFAQNGRLAPTSPFAMPMGQFGHQFYSHPQQNFATAFWSAVLSALRPLSLFWIHPSYHSYRVFFIPHHHTTHVSTGPLLNDLEKGRRQDVAHARWTTLLFFLPNLDMPRVRLALYIQMIFIGCFSCSPPFTGFRLSPIQRREIQTILTHVVNKSPDSAEGGGGKERLLWRATSTVRRILAFKKTQNRRVWKFGCQCTAVAEEGGGIRSHSFHF